MGFPSPPFFLLIFKPHSYRCFECALPAVHMLPARSVTVRSACTRATRTRDPPGMSSVAPLHSVFPLLTQNTKFLQRYKSFPQNIQKGGVAHFGAAYYEQLLHTEDTKYRLSRAHFYDDQFILARTGEVRMPSFLMDIVFNWKNSSTFCPLKTHGLM